MKDLHFAHWTKENLLALEKATSFTELANLALDVIGRKEHGIHMVSGPISTGGVGNIQGNMKVFSGVIENLVEEGGVNIFSQMPFEDKFREIYLKWKAEDSSRDYCMPVLEEFYETVFSSPKVTHLHFIHGYESSFGARWEHDGCERWNIERIYLPREISEEVLKQIKLS